MVYPDVAFISRKDQRSIPAYSLSLCEIFGEEFDYRKLRQKS